MKHLLFQLYGPMAGWGDVAVGQVRPSFTHPSHSAITGMIAAALGIERHDEAKQLALRDSVRCAFKVHTSGELLRDYHTTQVPGERKGVTHHTRRNELLAPKLNTILSSRDYRCDAFIQVAVWNTADASVPLETIQAALERPIFTLYLGRKSCPLALPLNAVIVEQETLAQVFKQSAAKLPAGLTTPRIAPQIWWDESHPNPGLEPLSVHNRKDMPISRQRWQFNDRRELLAKTEAST